MSYTTEFIIDRIMTRDEIHQFEHAVTLVTARWKITHADYPNGFAYHKFNRYFHHDTLEAETFVPIEDVTDEMIEQWCTGDIVGDKLMRILNNALPVIKFTDQTHGLTEHYRNPDLP